jgi:hypothetical protein
MEKDEKDKEKSASSFKICVHHRFIDFWVDWQGFFLYGGGVPWLIEKAPLRNFPWSALASNSVYLRRSMM